MIFLIFDQYLSTPSLSDSLRPFFGMRVISQLACPLMYIGMDDTGGKCHPAGDRLRENIILN